MLEVFVYEIMVPTINKSAREVWLIVNKVYSLLPYWYI